MSMNLAGCTGITDVGALGGVHSLTLPVEESDTESEDGVEEESEEESEGESDAESEWVTDESEDEGEDDSFVGQEPED
jgi:hypothetical protein